MCPRVVLALLTALPLLAQEATIRVEVRAADSKVGGASVSLNSMPLRTDRSGIAIGAVPLGNIAIKVSKPGFLPATTTIQVDEARQYDVAVELHEQPEELEQITVHATRTEARLQDSPTRVEVLGVEEIDEKTMMTPGDIVMMLNEMGGLRVQTISPSLGAASVRIQGMRGRYTRFLSDGLPLFGGQGGGLGLLQIPPSDLGQVEVIKGASSALYGAGAMAGVVNLISRRPAAEPVHELLINRSTLGATDASLFLAGKVSERWGASLLTGADFQTHNDRDGDGWADLAGYGRGVAHPRFFWDGGEGRTGFLTGGVTYETRSGGTLPGRVLPQTSAPYREALDTQRYDLGGSYQFLLAKSYVVTARGAFSRQVHDHQFGEVRERDRHQLTFGEVTVRGSAGRHTWVAGTAVEDERYNPLDVPRFAYRYTTPGIFAQDDVALTPWLSFSASARADFHNRYGNFFSPRLAGLLRWKGWTSRIYAGQGFFAPTPLTEETEAAGLSRLSIPAPLKAESGRSASLDLTRAIGAFSGTATVFASGVRHPIAVHRTTSYELVNLTDTSRNRGVELLGTWRKSPVSATVSYAYVDSTEVEFGQRLQTELTPRQSFGITAMWEQQPWRVGVECYYTGRQRLENNPYRTESKPYVSTGFLVERKFGPVRLFLNAENLTGVRQTRWDSLLRPTRGVDGRWTVDAWAPLDGRVINGGVRLSW